MADFVTRYRLLLLYFISHAVQGLPEGGFFYNIITVQVAPQLREKIEIENLSMLSSFSMD